MEMESDEMSSEVREMSSVDALVENTAIDGTDCSTELNNVVQPPQSADEVAMPECANCVRLSKRNRQLSNQPITAQTKHKKSAKEVKALKKQLEENISGVTTKISEGAVTTEMEEDITAEVHEDEDSQDETTEE